MGVAFFSGKFEHCAAAAGQATESAVLNAGIPEDIAHAANQAATDSAIKSLKEGKSPAEAAIAAAAAAYEAAIKQGADENEAFLAAAAAGAAAAAAASSNSEEDAKIASTAAAYAAAMDQPGNAGQVARKSGGSASVISNAASGAAEGINAANQLPRKDEKDHSPNPNPTNVTKNSVPVAKGGHDQTVYANTEVILDGSKSSDEDGKLVSFKWKQTHGPKVDIKGPDEAMASFNAPSVSKDSKLTFKLTVTDDQDSSKSDQVSINVKSNTEPQTGEDKSNTEPQTGEDKSNTEPQTGEDKNNTESKS